METTTQSTSPVVRPSCGQLVHVAFGPGHRIGGKVVAVDDDSIDVLAYMAWEDDTETDYDEFDPEALFTLFDVEQADARCVVTVL